MRLETVTFKNKNGDELRGNLQFPDNQSPKAYAIFAHCFTCGKNLKVIKEISSALTESGLAVLRFDFTGLGQSEGEFGETDFSHDVEDLLEASGFLEKEYQAPSLIIGHSLGGTAALFAAKELDNIKAVATIASPSQPSHIQNLLKDDVEDIENKKEAVVNIGGKDFKVKKRFFDDVMDRDTKSFLGELKKPFLIMHSPQDQIVSIENAEDLYKWAHHPKSFISFDKADHLLNEDIDASYIGKLIGPWASRYLAFSKLENPALSSESQSAAILHTKDKFTTQLKAGDFGLVGDEPEDHGGHNFGPSPYDLLSAGLAECTAMTIQAYARHKEWDLKEVRVHIDHTKKKVETENENSKEKDVFHKKIEIKGSLDESQIECLHEVGDRCPVHKTLCSEIEITSELIN